MIQRPSIIDRSYSLPITCQAQQLMLISQSSVYYCRKPACESQVQFIRPLPSQEKSTKCHKMLVAVALMLVAIAPYPLIGLAKHSSRFSS